MSIVVTALITKALHAVVSALGTWLLGELIGFVRHRRRQEQEQSLLELLDEVVRTGVRELEQVKVLALKRQNVTDAAGKLVNVSRSLSPEQVTELKRESFQFVIDHFGARRLLQLARFLGVEPSAAEQFVQSRIERAVYELRSGGR